MGEGDVWAQQKVWSGVSRTEIREGKQIYQKSDKTHVKLKEHM